MGRMKVMVARLAPMGQKKPLLPQDSVVGSSVFNAIGACNGTFYRYWHRQHGFGPELARARAEGDTLDAIRDEMRFRNEPGPLRERDIALLAQLAWEKAAPCCRLSATERRLTKRRLGAMHRATLQRFTGQLAGKRQAQRLVAASRALADFFRVS